VEAKCIEMYSTTVIIINLSIQKVLKDLIHNLEWGEAVVCHIYITLRV